MPIKTKTAKTTDFSITRVAKSKEFADLERGVKDIVAHAKAIRVTDESSREITIAHLENLNRGIKGAEALRKQFVKPIKDSAAAIDKWFRENTAPWKEANLILRSKVDEYVDAEEARIAKETADRDKEHTAANKEVTDLGAAPVAAPAALAPMSMKTEGSSSSSRKVLDIEIVDLSKVPVKFLILNEVEVKIAYKNGEQEIPGLKLTEKNKLTVR